LTLMSGPLGAVTVEMDRLADEFLAGTRFSPCTRTVVSVLATKPILTAHVAYLLHSCPMMAGNSKVVSTTLLAHSGPGGLFASADSQDEDVAVVLVGHLESTPPEK